jgi:tetratricopeptide (TPR) repeat protein
MPGPGRTAAPGARASVLALAAVCLLVNLPALRPGFIHDDHKIIEQNERIRDLSRAPRLFLSGYWTTGEVEVPSLYRPVTILSFALNHAVSGLRPFPFRLFNLLIHLLNTVLVFWIARRLFGAPPGRSLPIPLLASLLFAVHPAHTEALGEVVGRAELLAGAGVLGSLLLFLRARDAEAPRDGPTERAGARTWPLYTLSIALFVGGFLSKENAVVAPALLLVADLLIVRRRPAWSFHLASATALLAALALRHAALGGLNPGGPPPFIDNPIAHLAFLESRLTALKVLARYAGLFVWPGRMSIDYSYRAILPVAGIPDAGSLAGIFVLLAWLSGLAWGWRRAPGLAFAFALTGLAFAPVANLLFPIGTVMAERLMYLPSAGVCLAAAAGLARLAAPPGSIRPRAGRIDPALLGAGILLAALSARTIVRLQDWRDDYTIFRAALRVVPDSVRALFNYGAACETRGDDEEAAGAYRKAIALWPDFAGAHYNLAGIEGRRKKWDRAVEEYLAALRLEPGNVQYLVNLARSLTPLGRGAEARDYLRRAIVLDPGSALAFTNLGAAELSLKNPQAAIEAYEEAARLEPGNADYLRNLGVAQHQAGDRRAAGSFETALTLRPGDPDLLDGLGLALVDAGRPQAALQPLRQAVSARPDHPVYHYHLARALEQAGEPAGAVPEYREAIRLAPAVPVPYRALGLLLDRQGDGAGALQALERAAELDPGGTVMDAQARGRLEALRRKAGRQRSP